MSTLIALDVVRQSVRTVLPVGPEPGAVALAPGGNLAYITITAANVVVVVDTTRMVIMNHISVGPLPYAIAISDDGDADVSDERAYVTHLLAVAVPGGIEATDTGRAGQVSIIDLGSASVTATVTLAPNLQGFANLLQGIALARHHAWLPHLRAAPALPNGLSTTVFVAPTMGRCGSAA